MESEILLTFFDYLYEDIDTYVMLPTYNGSVMFPYVLLMLCF